MVEKIWDFANENSNTSKNAYQYLYDYASKVKNDTSGLIEGQVVELVSDASEEIIYALYLVVPELRNYSYRLIEVIQKNAINNYPVTVSYFGPQNNDSPVICTEENFEPQLLKYIQSPLTKEILTSLKTHIDIKRDYNK